jgi:hypothetical protein
MSIDPQTGDDHTDRRTAAMTPDPTFNYFEANRRIADAQALAAAERLVRGTSDVTDRHGVLSTLAAAFRRLTPAAKPAVSDSSLHAAHPR